MPRPFGVWAPATTLAEYRARIPSPFAYSFRLIYLAKNEVFYPPEALAHFKDPQQFKDAVNTLRAMQVSDKIFGEGQKLPKNWLVPLAACLAAHAVILIAGLQYYYGVHMPANNPTWRKVVNKEWEEAINTSPWDHMSHVWQYSDNYAAVLGDIAAPGPRRFYIPA
ncbi:cytochrome c oxidase VII [Strigomonas culicis]|uniref:Cytochrome c oxidase VII n=1 Tax=Strigomonas culicis TaxID=28005 RepID=S9W741_9TRYP|nr:cytochrome c oxidase VII [Strigomonas culicis]EPY34246.1 cytochrome c oxidase VII [Strigomonas culicis]|eukprot:EPY31770.1 cytochrome c oxidase VII [Strigomonas culicis]